MNAAFHRLGHRQNLNPSNYARKFAETQMVYILPHKLLVLLEPTELLEDGNLATSNPRSIAPLSALPFHRSGHRHLRLLFLAILLLTGCEESIDPNGWMNHRRDAICNERGGVMMARAHRPSEIACYPQADSISLEPRESGRADTDSSIITRPDSSGGNR